MSPTPKVTGFLDERLRKMRCVRKRRFAIGCLIIAALLTLVCTTSCARQVDHEAEARFQELFGSTLSKRMVIAPDKHRYQQGETIVFWVENRTDGTIWFHDQSFGVHALAYDKHGMQWIDVDLGFVESNPAPTAVQPGLSDFPGILPIEYIAVPEGGRIRLVIRGHTDLSNPEHDEIFTAYTDIEIVPP